MKGIKCWTVSLILAAGGPLTASALAQEVTAGVAAQQPLEVWQQQAEIAGTVVDSRSNPLEGVRVGVVNGPEVVTDARGRFRIGNLTGAQVTLRVVMIGYGPGTETVRVGDVAVRIVLTESVINLDELVVTGTAGGTEKRAIGNVVGRVMVSEVVEAAPPVKIQDVLAVSVPGVQILRAEGQVGSGARTRIRGSASLSLSNEPLIYVDGIRVNNESAAPGSYLFIAATSRMNDLNPEEIESIEILKGPSESPRGVLCGRASHVLLPIIPAVRP